MSFSFWPIASEVTAPVNGPQGQPEAGRRMDGSMIRHTFLAASALAGACVLARLRLRPSRCPADLALSLTRPNLGMLTQGPAVMIGRPPPPAAPRFRSTCGPDVPLRSGWSGHCLQILERVLPTLHARKTQDKCQSRRDRGALAACGGASAAAHPPSTASPAAEQSAAAARTGSIPEIRRSGPIPRTHRPAGPDGGRTPQTMPASAATGRKHTSASPASRSACCQNSGVAGCSGPTRRP